MKIRNALKRSVAIVAIAGLFAAPALAQSTAVPVPLSNATDSPLRIKAPKGAPNVVVVLLDDVGFSASGTFGGLIPTPQLDKLAGEGLRYNRFHTTSICSPTRASLLTGRNPHAVHMGTVMNTADDRLGYSGFQTKDAVSIAELLRRAGYNTAAFGKWHQTPDSEASPNGPFDRWPTGQGFERFYGFIGGETDQFEPSLYEGTHQIPVPQRPGYHLTEDLADRAITWLNTQHSIEPDRPAFLYFAPGATHAPLQPPREWIDRFKGKFDAGWDALREEIFARQKRMGIIPANTKLTPRLPQLPAWSSLTADQKRVAARLMEIYAAFLAHTDAQVGRLVEALKANGEFDNTLFVYVVGDNGGSPEGTISGSVNYVASYQNMPETDELMLAQFDKLGGPGTNTHYPAAWAWALNTPFQWTKTVASHLGGTRNGMVVTWPKRIGAAAGGLRSQFGHVNDITPTILEAVGMVAPEEVDGVKQLPMDGTSLIYSFGDAKAAERHTTQYFEVFGNRAIYHNGWMASAFHGRVPWIMGAQPVQKFEEDKWELYDLSRDFSQSRDLAARYPEKLAELKALFDKEGARNNVLPLSEIRYDSGLPSLSAGKASASYKAGATGIPETALPRFYGNSWTVDANFTVDTNAQGVLAAVGGSAGGWSLFVRPDGKPAATYRLFNIQSFEFVGSDALTPGAHKLTLDFANSGGYGKGGTLRFMVDGKPVGTGELVQSPIASFSLDDTFGVGVDSGSMVGPYPTESQSGFPFRGGQIDEVVLRTR